MRSIQDPHGTSADVATSVADNSHHKPASDPKRQFRCPHGFDAGGLEFRSRTGLVWWKCHHHRSRGDGKLSLSNGCHVRLGSGGEILILDRVHLVCMVAELVLQFWHRVGDDMLLHFANPTWGYSAAYPKISYCRGNSCLAVCYICSNGNLLAPERERRHGDVA